MHVFSFNRLLYRELVTIPVRVSYRGGIPPPSRNFPSPEIMKLGMVIIVLSQVLNNNLVPDCVRSNLRGSKFKTFPGGACPQTPLVGTQAFHTLLSPCYHAVPPPHLKILYETLPMQVQRFSCTS